jgi:hypothetical protein
VASGRGCGAPTLRSLGSSRGISLVRSSLYFIHRSWWERRSLKHVCRIANRSAPRRGTRDRIRHPHSGAGHKTLCGWDKNLPARMRTG